MPRPVPLTEVPGPTDRLWLELSDAADPSETAHPSTDGELDGHTDGETDGETDAEEDGETVYRFDLTWLTSSWSCIFGAGCPGIDAAAPDAGCCVHGAWFSEPADEERVAAAVARLTDATWAQHGHDEHGAGAEWAVTDADGDRRTAQVGGACVFHNPRDFAGGYGCALHGLALREGLPPLATKPDVCWQLPLRRTYATVERPDGSSYLQVTVTEYRRSDWGGGGADFDWYCSTSPAAHTGARPVWQALADELVELVGADVYRRLAEHCEQLRPARPGRRLLPLSVLPAAVHPATRAARVGTTGAGGGR